MKLRNSIIALATLILSLVLVQTVTAEQASRKFGETDRFSWGGDIRIRGTRIDRNTFSPDGAIPSGPDVQWLRVRTRLWMDYALSDKIRFDLRLAHRWHHVSSHFLDPNNQDTTTWRFPDEVIFDQLKITVDDVGGLPLRLTIGRQDLILGRGMIVLEGTAYDQGRGIYFDGLRGTWQQGNTTVDLFGFYSSKTDDFIVINDRNRLLRRGDTLLTGIYWTEKINPAFNTDLYYMYNQIRDDFVVIGDGVRDDVRLHITGGRIFGKPHDLIDYSAEFAVQRGKLRQTDRDMKGMMSDLRLGFLLPGNLPFSPKLNLQYTWMRGEDKTANTYKGWHPVAAEYPIWREELMPIANRGNWTNLHNYRLEAILQLHDKVRWTNAGSLLRADTVAGYNDPFGNPRRGKTMGQLYSSFLDYSATKKWTLRLEAALLKPGSYYASDNSAHWLRLESYYRF